MSSIGRRSAACSAASAKARAGVIADRTRGPAPLGVRSDSTRRSKSGYRSRAARSGCSRIEVLAVVVTVHRYRSAAFRPVDRRVTRPIDQMEHGRLFLRVELAQDVRGCTTWRALPDPDAKPG